MKVSEIRKSAKVRGSVYSECCDTIEVEYKIIVKSEFRTSKRLGYSNV